MSDLISRRAALDMCREPRMRNADCSDFEMEIMMLPSAQPERKTGKWIPLYDDTGEHYGDKCSECGEWYVMPYGKTKFCPDCGCQMLKGEDNATLH